MQLFFSILFGALFVLIVWIAYGYFAVRGVEEPSYRVIEVREEYEIRVYEPMLVAETTVEGDYRNALNRGFVPLADYIFGNNTAKSSIAMTVPVTEARTEVDSEKLAMTIPVLEREEGTQMRTIAFVLPASYTLDTIPQPNNTRVTVRRIPGQTVAVRAFGWIPTDRRVAEQKSILNQALAHDGIMPVGGVQSALYNPPWTPPFMLRNEVLVSIDYETKE